MFVVPAYACGYDTGGGSFADAAHSVEHNKAAGTGGEEWIEKIRQCANAAKKVFGWWECGQVDGFFEATRIGKDSGLATGKCQRGCGAFALRCVEHEQTREPVRMR